MAKMRKSLTSISFKLFCLTGFVYQISQIFLQYFAYKTTTKVALQRDSKSNNPSIIICTRFTDIIDRRNHEKYGIHAENRYNFSEIFSDMSKLTIKDVFDLTPKPENAMIGCQFRENDYDVNSYPRDQCYSIFRVTKYLEGAFICYQFRTIVEDSNFRCDLAPLSYHSINDLYVILLHQQFLNSNAVKLISHIPGNFINFHLPPLISRRYFGWNLRYGDGRPDTSSMNYIQISGDLHSITRLQKPYETACVERVDEAYPACRRNCNIESFKRHNLFPPNEFTTEPLPLKTLNHETLANKTLLQDIENKNKECTSKCTQDLCHDWYSVTSVASDAFKFNETLSIVSACSIRPTVAIQYLPKLTLMDLILYCSSSLGIWFGFSVISVNPFHGKNGKVICNLRHDKLSRDVSDTILQLNILKSEMRQRLTRLENLH